MAPTREPPRRARRRELRQVIHPEATSGVGEHPTGHPQDVTAGQTVQAGDQALQVARGWSRLALLAGSMACTAGVIAETPVVAASVAPARASAALGWQPCFRDSGTGN
jgi:hypothetical protein